MNNLLIGIACITLLALVMFMCFSSEETYTKTKQFGSSDNFLTMDAKGNIKLQPVSNIDKAINTTADSVLSDVASAYYTKKMHNDYNSGTIRAKYQTKSDAAAAKKLVADTYQPKGDYVKRNTHYAIKMGPGSHASGTHYMVGTSDNWRVAYNGSKKSKWSFV